MHLSSTILKFCLEYSVVFALCISYDENYVVDHVNVFEISIVFFEK